MLNDLDAPALPSGRWSWKKLLLIALGILAAFIGTILCYDSKLEPYDDLVPPYVKVAHARTNGYFFLKERWEKLHYNFNADERKAWEMMEGAKPWVHAFFEKSRIYRENMVAELKTALAMPEYFAPPDFPPLPDEPEPDSPARFIRSWTEKPLTDLTQQLAVLMHEGNYEAALDLVIDLHRFSARQINGSTTFTSLMEGVRIQSAAAIQTCELLEQLNPNEAQAAALARLWSTGPDLLSPWRRVLLNESAYLRDNWNALKSLQWKQPGFAQKLQALLIKQNQTLNFIHQERRQLIKLGFGVFPSVEDAQAVGWGPAKRRSSIIRELDLTNLSKLFLPPHALWSMISSLLNRSIFQPRVLQVRIAIDRWRLKHPGKWPAKLDELVPDYLPEIPADPWNGKPLTWEPTSHFIQAVGSDWTTDPPRFYSDKQWFGDHPDSPGLRCELPAATAIGTPRPSAPKAPNPPIPPTE